MSCFNIGGFMYTNQLCCVNNQIVLNGCESLETGSQIRIYNMAGGIVTEWKSCCSLCSIVKFKVGGKAILLETCQICKVIRTYEFPDIRPNRRLSLLNNVYPSVFCEGPNGAILAFEEKQKSILHFHYSESQFSLVGEVYSGTPEVFKMCYSDHCDVINCSPW